MDKSYAASLSFPKPISYRQENLRQAILKIDGIKEVYVSICGKTALIGFLKDESVSEGENLSEAIKITVLKTDPEISYVSVSRSPDVLERIKALSKT